MSAEGKDPHRIAGQGAFRPQQSPDGKWLYYTRRGVSETGIWRMPVTGGAEEKITAELTPNFWGQWAVGNYSLFYAVFPPSGNRRAISRIDLTTGKVRDIFELPHMPVQFDSGMCVSPDESALYWSQLDQAGSDVFLVSGFR